jgi:hypothetical protein
MKKSSTLNPSLIFGDVEIQFLASDEIECVSAPQLPSL